MAILNVLHFPDPRLRKKAVSVEQLDSSIESLAKNMIETMYTQNGIGLAATQVNVHKRVVVIDLSTDKNDPKILVNPEILSKEGAEEMREGCLSVPDVFDVVKRAEKIKFRYLQLDGQLMELNADGLLAVCVQHEIDHLNGKLFIDYFSPLKRHRLLKKLNKQEKFQTKAL